MGWIWILLSLFPVSYRAGQEVYLEGGRNQGLHVGMVLVVVRDSADTLGRVEVVSLTRRTALCRILEEQKTILPGDRAFPIPSGSPGRSTGQPLSRREMNTSRSASGVPWRISGVTSVDGERLDLGGGRWSQVSTARFRVVAYTGENRRKGWTIHLWGRHRWVVRTQVLSVPDRERWWTLYEGAFSYQTSGWMFQGGRFVPASFPEGGMVDGLSLVYTRGSRVRGGFLMGWPAQADSLPTSGRIRLGGWLGGSPGGILVRTGVVQDRQRGQVERERWLFRSIVRRGGVFGWLSFQINRYPATLYVPDLPSWALTRLRTGVRGPLPWSLRGALYARWDRVEWTPALVRSSLLPTNQPRQVLGAELSGTPGTLRWSVLAEWLRRPDAVEQLRLGTTWAFRMWGWWLRPSLDLYRNDLMWGGSGDLSLSGYLLPSVSLQAGVREEGTLLDADWTLEPAAWMRVYLEGPGGTFLTGSLWAWEGIYRQGTWIQMELGVRW